jgi:hypothetical protein
MTTAELLVRLATHPDELELFRSGPEGREEYLSRFPLSEEQKQVLRAGDLIDIRYMVEADFEVPTVSEETEQAAASASDAPATETTTVSFVRPVWVRPVWIKHDE